MNENYAVLASAGKGRSYHLILKSFQWRRLKIENDKVVIKNPNKPLKVKDNGSYLIDTILLYDGITLIDGHFWNEQTHCYESYTDEGINNINEGVKEDILDGELVEVDCLFNSFSQQQTENIFNQFKAIRKEFRASQKAL